MERCRDVSRRSDQQLTERDEPREAPLVLSGSGEHEGKVIERVSLWNDRGGSVMFNFTNPDAEEHADMDDPRDATLTPTPTETPTDTPEPSPTATETPEPSPTPTETPEPSPTRTATPADSSDDTGAVPPSTPSPTETATETPDTTPTPTPDTDTDTDTSSPTPTSSDDSTPTPSPSPTPVGDGDPDELEQPEPDDQPGFGVIPALGALGGLAYVLKRMVTDGERE